MREYHCTTCDFHITGPANEVADEIEAHEEQHHADAAAVSGIEVTPEILRAVASWLPCESTADEDAVDALRRHARHLEREQSDEKRIDELAQMFLRAEKEIAIYGLVDWANQSENQRDAYRAGIRAVLAKLDEDPR
ncbi:hypothetical protein [Rhodococcus sp. Chr-9]|uniref:hypothetical protein n=1 Tax=Rhodococcus sp. Chr-9 TaxID=713612 RepID=UPI0005740644|nr:hypothetical protein [Rhodococcus sp. Chr-9]KHJ74666.1 hypothetical protein QR64_00330 [Rhodococcus sp. Chr-9]